MRIDRLSVWLLAAILMLIPAFAAASTVVVEDFEDGPVAAFDPFINYQFLSPGLITANLLNDFFSPPGHLLFLSRNTTAVLTFNTLSFQTIASASLEFADHSGNGSPTFVQFIGTNGTEQFSIKNSGPSIIGTAGLGLGAITQIRFLGSLESAFDNITLEVVPEPSAVSVAATLLLALGVTRRSDTRGI